MSGIRDELARIGQKVRERFGEEKRVLSTHEYLDLFVAHPWRYTRDSSRYLRDCFDFYGTYELDRPWGEPTRWKLFDLPFEESVDHTGHRRSDRLIGHEFIQGEVYRILQNFVQEGRANRLILMHGPNGSAKSTFSACVMRALEHYSMTDEGALYKFSWIFPRGRDGKGIGFGSSDEGPRPGESYAHLPEERIEVKLSSDLREHPLLLLPMEDRRRLVERAFSERGVSEPPPDGIWSGQLGQKNRQIFEALLTAYRGDLERVLGHVQVERYYLSRRYRVGAVTIGPQMAVDAHERQLTADRTLNQLPASLSALTLFEPYGELVDASGGVVEYSDLLKRPLEAWKYLLLAIEAGEVSLPFSNLPLNSVMIASSNELHLNAFKEHPEYNSFRGRIQLVRVPYLLDYTQEQGIYDAQIVPQVRRHVAPHVTFMAAMWAVLSRLRRPQADRYSRPSLGRVAASLTPLEKAELYANGKIPVRLSADDTKELRASIAEVYEESRTSSEYEGLFGASPREIRTLLLDAAHDVHSVCVSPVALADRIEAFCKRRDFDFLKQSPDSGYHDHLGFLRQVRQVWLDRVDDEVRSSTGLIDETQYTQLFDRYITHVSYWVKRERVYNSMTGKYENPDPELMDNVEEKLGVRDDPEEFRRNLISTVAAHAIDHPDEMMDRSRMFPRYIERLKEAYFGERRKQVTTIMRDILRQLAGEVVVEPDRSRAADTTLGQLKQRFGYEESSARIAIAELMKERYRE